MNSSNSSVLGLPYCSPARAVPEAEYGLLAVNALAVILNAIHISILSRMPSLKATAYLHVLLHLSVADVAFACSMTIETILNKSDYYSTVSVHSVALTWALHTTALWIRYWLMAAASFDRYYALCHATVYKNARVTKTLHIWLPFVWPACFLMAMAYMYSWPLDICFSRLVGPFFLRTPKLLAFFYVAQFAPSLMTAVLLARILVELYRMRRRMLTRNERIVKTASKYFISITVLLYLGMLPPLITNIVLHVCERCFSVILIFYINNQLSFSLYGIFNVFVFGFMTPAYRRQIRVVCCRGNRLSSSDLPGSTTQRRTPQPTSVRAKSTSQ